MGKWNSKSLTEWPDDKAASFSTAQIAIDVFFEEKMLPISEYAHVATFMIRTCKNEVNIFLIKRNQNGIPINKNDDGIHRDV